MDLCRHNNLFRHICHGGKLVPELVYRKKIENDDRADDYDSVEHIELPLEIDDDDYYQYYF